LVRSNRKPIFAGADTWDWIYSGNSLNLDAINKMHLQAH